MNLRGHKFDNLTWVVVGIDFPFEAELPANEDITQMAPHVFAGNADIANSSATGVLTLKSEIYFGCGFFELSRGKIPISRVRVVWNDRRSAEQWAAVRTESRKLPAPTKPSRHPPPIPWVAELYSARFGEIPMDDVFGISEATCAIACAMLRIAKGSAD